MAGSDPKTNRALEQASARADIDAEEDPLIELARIVSEDGGFSGSRAEKPKMSRGEPNGRDTLADGLEAELLQELETSFAVREAPTPPRAPAAANPPPVQRAAAAPVRQQPAAEEEADPDDLLRSIEEQLSQFERRQAGRFAPPSTFSPELPDPEPVQSQGLATVQEPEEAPFGAPERVAEPRDDWQNRRTSRIRPFAESAEALEEEVGSAPEPTFEEAPAVRSEYRFRGPANAEWDRASAAHEEQQARQDDGDRRIRETTPPLFADDLLQPEPEAQVEPVLAAPKNARVRADDSAAWAKSAKPSDARRERLLATFPEFEEPAAAAERPAPDLTGIEEGLSLALEPIRPTTANNTSTTAAADKWEDGDALDEEEPRVAAAIPPGSSRRAAAARAAAQQRGRSRIGLFAALIIVVVVIGGVGAFYLRSSESTPSGPPPVIAAEPGAVRVDAAPDQSPAAGSETVGEAVYNRVAGAAPSTNEQVVENSEEPKEIARIVLPQSQSDSGQTVVRPVGGEESAAATDPTQPPPSAAAGAPTASSEAEIGPRRVPTFVVKADGSIVSTSEAGAPPPTPPAAQDPLANETQPIQPVPVPTVAIAPQAAAPTNGATATSPPVPTPPAVEPAPAGAADLETRPTIDEPPAEVATATQSGAATAPASNATVASAEPATPPVSAGGGYLVQLSAQKSMDQAQAAYAKARQNFPALLGNLEPNIQQADLGTKGIYFRVRVGPWDTRDEALVVCEALKTAGGSCFVTQ